VTERGGASALEVSRQVNWI